MNLNELNDKVIAWADDRGILKNATPAAQYQKTMEEVGELGRALVDEGYAKIAWNLSHQYEDSVEVSQSAYMALQDAQNEIQDAIGDITVTLIIQCALNGITLQDCLQQAYDVISQRKGKMVDGIFVKDE